MRHDRLSSIEDVREIERVPLRHRVTAIRERRRYAGFRLAVPLTCRSTYPLRHCSRR